MERDGQHDHSYMADEVVLTLNDNSREIVAQTGLELSYQNMTEEEAQRPASARPHEIVVASTSLPYAERSAASREAKLESQLQALQNQVKHMSEYLTTIVKKLPQSNEVGTKPTTSQQDSGEPCSSQLEEIMPTDPAACIKDSSSCYSGRESSGTYTGHQGDRKRHASGAYLEETHPISATATPLRAYRGKK